MMSLMTPTRVAPQAILIPTSRVRRAVDIVS